MSALYVYDPRTVAGVVPTTTWGRPPSGRCVAYAVRDCDGWRLRDLIRDRTTHLPDERAAAERLHALVDADPALTLGGAR